MVQVALTGATGLIGNFCLNFLLDSENVDEVIVLTRRPIQQAHPKLKVHVIDLSQMNQLVLPDTQLTAALCCLGTTIKQAGSQKEFRKVDLEYVIDFAKWSKEHQAQHFLVVSSIGASEKSIVFYNRVKGEMETHVRKLGFENLDIYRPSLLVGPRKTPRLKEKLGEKLLNAASPLLVGPLKDLRPTEAKNVAQAMVQQALMTAAPGIRVHSPDDIRSSIAFNCSGQI